MWVVTGQKGLGRVWAVNPNLFLDFAACESGF